MKLTGPAMRLTVLVGEDETWHHRRVFAEIVHRAHEAGLDGVSVLAGIEGFGSGWLIHTDRFLDLCENLPVAVVIVDTEEQIKAFLPQLEDRLADSRILLDSCEAIRYISQDQPGAT